MHLVLWLRLKSKMDGHWRSNWTVFSWKWKLCVNERSRNHQVKAKNGRSWHQKLNGTSVESGRPFNESFNLFWKNPLSWKTVHFYWPFSLAQDFHWSVHFKLRNNFFIILTWNNDTVLVSDRFCGGLIKNHKIFPKTTSVNDRMLRGWSVLIWVTLPVLMKNNWPVVSVASG